MAEPPDRVAAEALFAKAFTLGELGRADEELAVYDELLARYGSATELQLREQVANALINKSVAFRALGRNGDEVAALEELVARFGSDEEPTISRVVDLAWDSLTRLAFEATAGDPR